MKNSLAILKLRFTARFSRDGFSILKYRALGSLGFRGKQCNVCNRDVAGFYYRCPSCYSFPRERFAIYALDAGLITFAASQPVRILHIAPGERGLVNRLQAIGEWVGGDIDPARYATRLTHPIVRVDLTKMAFEQPFNIIYASHVLEHILDDAAAMRGIYDHLLPGGLAIILVPLEGKTTIEGGPHLTAAERTRRFGQYDHVRMYGTDIIDRLNNVGFEVTTLNSDDLDSDVIQQHGLTHSDTIFICRKVN